MIRYRQLVGIVSVAAVALVPCNANAQTLARSFAELKPILKPGQKVVVTDETGRRTKGDVLSISPSELVLIRPPLNERRMFTEDAVREVGSADSLLNGAGIGAAVGLAVGLAFVPAYYNCLHCGGDISPAQLYTVFGVLGLSGGALIGAGVDARMNKALYGSLLQKRRVTLSPFLGPDRRGVVASLRF